MKKLSRALAAVLSAGMLLSLAGCGGSSSSTASSAAPSSSAPASTVDPASVSGSFEGTAPSYDRDLTVTVTFDAGKITDIELGDNHDTSAIISRAFPVIEERIVEANSPVVDSVSGATFTSFGVKAAVANAMAAAGLEAPEITFAHQRRHRVRAHHPRERRVRHRGDRRAAPPACPPPWWPSRPTRT